MLDASTMVPDYIAAQVEAERRVMDELYGLGRTADPVCPECEGAGHYKDDAPARYPGSPATVTRCMFCNGSGRI